MVKYEEALKIIDNYQFKTTVKTLSSLNALNYVLAQDIYAKTNVPNFRKSAMDGYAINKNSDLTKPFKIIETNYAGTYNNPKLKVNECVRIMTGSFVPDDANQIIVQELANRNGNIVTFNIPKTKLNDNLCNIGEDIKLDQLLFTKGTLITPSIISSLISSGNHNINVYGKPNILLLTTGDEVRNDDSNLNIGEIYNSNLGYLLPRLNQLGFECEHIHLTDDQAKLESVISTTYDLIISTGAISVGEKDIIRNFINGTNATVLFDRVNIMPGGPVCFWQHNQTPIISLAGSPFANFVTFELFARRILSKITNDESLIARERQAVLNDYYCKTLKKQRFIKAHINNNKVTIPANNHLASSMHEMCLCNGLISLSRGDYDLKPGDRITFIYLRRNNE